MALWHVFLYFHFAAAFAAYEMARSCNGRLCTLSYHGQGTYAFGMDVPVTRLVLPDRFDGPSTVDVRELSVIEDVVYEGPNSIDCSNVITSRHVRLIVPGHKFDCFPVSSPSSASSSSSTSTSTLRTRQPTLRTRQPTLRTRQPAQSSTSSSTHVQSPSSSTQSPRQLSPSHSTSDDLITSTVSLAIIVGSSLILIGAFLVLHHFKIINLKHVRLGNTSIEMSGPPLGRFLSDSNLTSTSTPISTISPTTLSPAISSPAISSLSSDQLINTRSHRYPTRSKRLMF